MANRARVLNYNSRNLIVLFAYLVVFSASLNGDNVEIGQEFTWADPRLPEELESMKYRKEDVVLQARTSQNGYRFGFVPFEAAKSHNYTRISIRCAFKITIGCTSNCLMSRVFVQIMEINNTDAHLLKFIPFSGYHFKNLFLMSAMHKSMEIPIPPAMMERWMKNEHAEIGFILKFDFGMLSNVTNVTVKVPVLIFSHSKRPKCSEHTCCLTANKTVDLTERPIFKNLIQPRSAAHQRCIECIRTSDHYEPDMGTFGMFLHNFYKPGEVPKPTQLGRCRAIDWSALQTTVKAKNDTVHQLDYPYFNAEKCECVEDDDISPDYEQEQQIIDHAARINKLRSKNRVYNH